MLKTAKNTLRVGIAMCLAFMTAWMSAAVPAQAAIRQLTSSNVVGVVTHFLASSDNTLVVFQTAGQLYSVPLAGGTATLLAESIGLTNNGPREFAISPDGTRVAYRGVPAASGQGLGLWVVPIQGGAAQLLTTAIPAETYYLKFDFSPDSSRVIFTAKPDSGSPYALYSVPVDGSRAPVLLSVTPEAGSSGVLSTWEAVAGTGRLIYEIAAPPQTGVIYTRVRLYSVPIDGPASSSVHLNPLYYASKTPWAYQLAPDHSRVIFSQGASLYSSDLLGQNLVRLDKDFPVSEMAGLANGFVVSPTSDRVVYRMWHLVNGSGQIDAYSVPVTGPSSASVQINPAPITSAPSLIWPMFTSSGDRVTFYATGGLYSAPAAGPSTGAVQIGSSFLWFPSPNGDIVLMNIASIGGSYDFAATSAALPTGVQWAVIDDALVDMPPDYSPLRRPLGLRFTPDGSRLIYQAANLHLYSVPVAGPIADTHDETQTPLAQHAEANWQISADSATLVYNVSGNLFATALGSGPLVSHLLPGCQSTPAAGMPIPTPVGANNTLHLPMVGRCYGPY